MEEDLDILIGNNLARLMQRAGISQNRLADMLDVQPSLVNMIVHGKKGMGKDIMMRVCKALEVQPWEFYVDETTPIVTDDKERRAVLMVRKAEQANLSHVVEEAMEYTLHRVEQSKKKLQAGRAREGGAARPKTRRG